MPALLIKDVPAGLHRKLKQVARRERRSMNQQALLLLEEALNRIPAEPIEWPRPVKGRFPVTNSFINRAKRAGRM